MLSRDCAWKVPGVKSLLFRLGWVGGGGWGGWVGREMNVKARLRSISSEIANWS